MSKSKLNLRNAKGMHDILPPEQIWWDKVLREFEYIADQYSFSRIETPIVEGAEIFEKSLGLTTDIVEKQMFSLKNTSDPLVLRPEGTAGIVRAYFQHGLSHLGQPLKLFYLGPMFRKEQPQAGRFRQFHQAGFEILGGEDDSVYDAQVILAMNRFLDRCKIGSVVELRLNSIGCRNCRPNYRKKLLDYYKPLVAKLCKDCQRRMKENPLRLLDCKSETCQPLKENLPVSLDYLCAYCSRHFKAVLEFLEELKISYSFDHYLVRGLDYYNRTVFEFVASINSETGEKLNLEIGGGGRYDYLLNLFSGREDGAGVGGAFGLERVIEAMKAAKVNLGIRGKRRKIFFVHIGDMAKKRSLALIEELRGVGVPVIESLGRNSLGAQLRSANKEDADYALLFGQKEAFEDSIIIRDLQSGVQETVPLKKMLQEVKKRLK